MVNFIVTQGGLNQAPTLYAGWVLEAIQNGNSETYNMIANRAAWRKPGLECFQTEILSTHKKIQRP